MKCHWTAKAEIAVAVPLAVTGGLSLFSRRRETRMALWATTGVLGVVTILLPTVLIGVCGMPDMVCNSTMRPIVTLAGALTIAIAAVGIVVSLTQKKDTEA